VIEDLTGMRGSVRVAERHILDSYREKQLVPVAQKMMARKLQKPSEPRTKTSQTINSGSIKPKS
jgi:hypothetical protein